MPLEGEAYAGRAFVVGLGYAPVPSKMASKITIAVFIAHAELWAENLRVQETEPHMYLGGKLVVAPLRKWVVEITDILTWIQALTIHAWIVCGAYPTRC